MAAKPELRRLNLLAWQERPKDIGAQSSLDNSIKKNTAFIKKCKTSLAADTSQQLLNDIQKLSLEKYILEIVSGVLEGMLKCKNSTDIAACVEVLSALHQRFPNSFTRLLTFNLAKMLQPTSPQHLASLTFEQREKEESTRITRQRTYMRISVELWLNGVLRNVEDGIPTVASGNAEGIESQSDSVAGLVGSTSTSSKRQKDTGNTKPAIFVYQVLKGLLEPDKVQHLNLTLAVAFLKYYGQEVVGITSRKQRAAAQQHEGGEVSTVAYPPLSGIEHSDTIVPDDVRADIKRLLKDYYQSAENHLVKMHKYIKKMEYRNREILYSRGELSEETKQKQERETKVYEKLLGHVQSLADTLDLEMPELPEDEETTKNTFVFSGTSTFEDKEFALNSIWEDEDARRFYEDLPDLRILVPSMSLDAKGNSVHDEAQEKKDDGTSSMEADVSVTSMDMHEEDMSEAEKLLEDDMNEDLAEDGELNLEGDIGQDLESIETDDLGKDEEGESSNTKPAQLIQLEAILARLPTLMNRDLIDKAAIEFCDLNSKMARSRLTKAILGVHRQRLDLLPYYARLIAILNPCFPDIGTAILNALILEFRGLRRKKNNDLLETRIKNIRFLSELTKFRVTPFHTIFSMLKFLLEDFTNQNIDVACSLLETCGRFLLKSPETGPRMTAMLETMMKKKKVQFLDNRQVTMIENAYYQANPPDKPAIVEKVRTPMELYVHKLIYGDLCKKSLDKTLKQLRKMHWEDPTVVRFLDKIFLKPWKIRYSNIHLLAILANSLSRYHSDFGVRVVDGVIEDVRLGLEQNIFKHNQRRVATIRYLGEMYNYRMIDSPLVFDTLYSIVTFGHEYGRPARERPCPIDAPNDFFRIRLCCTLLDTCGMCFDRGSSRRKLDSFLTFFQMYILSKEKLSMDVDFMVSDTFEMLRPKLLVFTTYQEANEAVDRMLLDQIKTVQGPDDKPVGDGFEDTEPSESSSDEEDEVRTLDEEDNEGASQEENVAVGLDDMEDNVVVLKKESERVSKEDDEAFERELTMMMNEPMDSRKFERKSNALNVPIPVDIRGSSQDPASDNKMVFKLLTKRGNKQQVRTMEVPTDSQLAKNTIMKQKAEEEEKEQMKRLVLSYEEREQAAARQAYLEEKAKQKSQLRGKRIIQISGGASNEAYGYGRR